MHVIKGKNRLPQRVRALDIEVPHRDFDESYLFTNSSTDPPPSCQEAGEVDCGWILKSNKTKEASSLDFSCSIQLNSLIDMSYQDHQPASQLWRPKAGADFNAFSAQTAAKVCKTIYLSSTASASKSYC